MPTEDRTLRDNLLELIRGRGAHLDAASALDGFPEKLRAVKPGGAPHNAWQLLEHIRFTLHDLLEFSANPKYLEPKWPEEYWPKEVAPPSDDAWDESVNGLMADLKAFEDLIHDPAGNIHATIPWGDGQTIFREILLAADHTSYHLGQLVFLRKQLEDGGGK